MAVPGSGLRTDAATVNLTEAITMVVDESPFVLELTARVLAGFGIRRRCGCQTADQAKAILSERQIDLILVSSGLPGGSGYDLVRWLRRSALAENMFAPVIMSATHVVPSTLARARDCGASLVLVKPFSPARLLERIVWAARDTRPFLETDTYRGPDRRLRKLDYRGPERRVAQIPVIERPAQAEGSLP